MKEPQLAVAGVTEMLSSKYGTAVDRDMGGGGGGVEGGELQRLSSQGANTIQYYHVLRYYLKQFHGVVALEKAGNNRGLRRLLESVGPCTLVQLFEDSAISIPLLPFCLFAFLTFFSNSGACGGHGVADLRCGRISLGLPTTFRPAKRL